MRIIRIALFALACLPCFALSKAALADEKPVFFSNPLIRENAALPKLQSLRFVTVDDFAPFSSFDQNNVLRGIHVDLARSICSALKITTSCTLQAAAFKDIENLLTTGQADIALAGLIPTALNRKALNFSIPYFRFPSKFLAKKGGRFKVSDTIGVITNSAHQEMATAMFSSAQKLPFNSEAEALAALKAGTVSVLFGDGLSLAATQATDSCCEILAGNYFLPTVRPDMLRAAVAKNAPDVFAAVNAALRQLAIDGGLDEIYLRQLPVNPLQ